MRYRATSRPRRPGGSGSRLIFALALAALAGCGDGATEPQATADLLGAEAGPADLGADQSAATSAEVTLSAAPTAALRLPKSFFVDPRIGNDANPGTKLKPFKTLARGLGLAIAGDTMRLASGVYSKATNGEKFTTGIQQVAVPAGVTILGTLADDFTSRLQGATGDSYGLNLKGTVTVRNLIVSGFPVGIRALQGVQTMKTVILDQNTLGLDLRGSAKATLTGSSVFLTPSPNLAGTIIGANLTQQAQLTLVGGSISGAGQNCRTNVAGVVLNDGSRLTMKSSATLKDIAGNALSLGGTSKALLTGLAAIDRSFSQLAGGCTPTPSVVTRDSASLTLKKARIVSTFGTSSIGVLSNSRALLTLDSAQVVGHSGAGIKSLGMLRLVSKPGSVIKGNSFGIDVSLALTDITISGTTITGNTVGIRATFFKLRNSKVTLNEVGILITGAIGADLGLTSDPGNNAITGNGLGVKFEPVEFDTEGTVDASGNTWEPSTQGSDGSGHYLQKPLVSGPTLGKNFQLTAFGTDIQL